MYLYGCEFDREAKYENREYSRNKSKGGDCDEGATVRG